MAIALIEALKKATAQTGSNEAAQTIVSRFEQMAAQRGNWESLWEEIVHYYYPTKEDDNFGLYSQSGNDKGESRAHRVYDSRGPSALTKFAAVMDSLLTPRHAKWQTFIHPDKAIMKDRGVREWLEMLTDTVFKRRYGPFANFMSQNNRVLKNCGGLGTAALFVDEASDMGLGTRYKSIPLSQLYIAENHQGIVDTVYRAFMMTSGQLIKQFGTEVAGAVIMSKYRTAPEEMMWVLHAVGPNIMYREDLEGYGPGGMPYYSYYILIDEKRILREGGYHTMPYCLSRYEIEDDEVYGRSPAMALLPTVKTLNAQKRSVLRQGNFATDPAWLLSDNGVLPTFKVRPGTMISGGLDAEGRRRMEPMPVGQVATGHQLMEMEHAAVDDGFFLNVFQVLIQNPQQTATEVLEKAREKNVFLSPSLGRQESEYLSHLAMRDVDIILRQGDMPPVPALLEETGGQYDLIYNNPLSKLQRAEETAGAIRTVQQAMEIAGNTQDMSHLDHFNFDKIWPKLAENQSMPLDWINPMKTVQQKRQARAQQQQEQQAQQGQQGEAAMLQAAAKMQESERPAV